MTVNVIDPIERISILFKLIRHYFKSSSIEFNIKLAIDLANTIDYIKGNINIINKSINSEYSEQLNKLLSIVLDYYPKILKDLNKTDINKSNNYINNTTEYCNNKHINIICCINKYSEVDFILNYIKNNINKNISIICVDEKVLNLLTIRLDFENIKYNNNAQYNKNYYKISPVFKNKIEYYFNDISKNDLIKITKLLSFMDITKYSDSNITVCDFQIYSNNIKDSDVVFCLSMNNYTWQLKNNVWFNSTNCKYNIDNIFKYILNNSKELYCTYSSTSIKSSVLNKLEVDNKYNLIFSDYNLPINNPKNIVNNNILIPQINNNLIVLSGSDVRNLLYDPNTFYFNNILGIKNNTKYDENNVYTLFKNIFYVYFGKDNNKTYDDILKNIEELDSLYYKKFQQIIDWLNNNYIINNNLDYILNNELLETNINNNLIIKTHCDRIEINNNKINIKKYCINKIANKSSILSGRESNLLTQALILKNNKIINEFSEISLEVVTPDWRSNVPVNINKFTLPINNINNYLENITNSLKLYSQNDVFGK